MGGIYFAPPQRIVFIKSPSVIGDLIGNLLSRSESVHDMPFAGIVSCSRANSGKALQVQLQLENGSDLPPAYGPRGVRGSELFYHR